MSTRWCWETIPRSSKRQSATLATALELSSPSEPSPEPRLQNNNVSAHFYARSYFKPNFVRRRHSLSHDAEPHIEARHRLIRSTLAPTPDRIHLRFHQVQRRISGRCDLREIFVSVNASGFFFHFSTHPIRFPLTSSFHP